ncbi:MAG TPA: hypothetical protein VGR47_16635 [Terracidiphilus sp.]|nr:hypothetical protein [Terracidiphilus sp.]
MSRSFSKNTVPQLWSRSSAGTWVRAHESTCSEGRADIVWGRFESGRSPKEIRKYSGLLQSPTASRILAALQQQFRSTEDKLLVRIGVTLPVLRRSLHALMDAELIEQSNDKEYRITRRNRLPGVEICSFELKLKNWHRALYQATRYRSFSHRVFVVMPTDAARAAYKHREMFNKANIGLVAHEASGVSHVLVRPEKRRPYSSHRTIMAIGMLSDSKLKLTSHFETT